MFHLTVAFLPFLLLGLGIAIAAVLLTGLGLLLAALAGGTSVALLVKDKSLKRLLLLGCGVLALAGIACVGLVLGYMTVEYNIGWAIVLHMFNNLILSDTMTRLSSYLPAPWGNGLIWAFIIICSIAALVVLLVNIRKIKLWLRRYQDDPLCAKAFWSAPGTITLVAVLGVLTVFTMVSLVIAA